MNREDGQKNDVCSKVWGLIAAKVCTRLLFIVGNTNNGPFENAIFGNWVSVSKTQFK